MKTIFALMLATALTSTFALAQTSDTNNSSGAGGTTTAAPATPDTKNSGTSDTDNSSGAGGTTTAAPDTKNKGTNDQNADSTKNSKMDSQACNTMRGKIHAGGAMTDAEAKPYLDKMMAMKMSPKTSGKLTDEEFMAACESGAFNGM